MRVNEEQVSSLPFYPNCPVPHGHPEHDPDLDPGFGPDLVPTVVVVSVVSGKNPLVSVTPEDEGSWKT